MSVIFFYKELLFETEEALYAQLQIAGIGTKTIQFGGDSGFTNMRQALQAAQIHSYSEYRV